MTTMHLRGYFENGVSKKRRNKRVKSTDINNDDGNYMYSVFSHFAGINDRLLVIALVSQVVLIRP